MSILKQFLTKINMPVVTQSVRTFACPPRKTPKCPQPKKKAKKRNPELCIVGPSGVHPAHEGGFKMYRNLFFFVCVPSIALAAYNLVNTFEEPERVPFAPYEHMRIRHKKFPWCGGTDKSFFHNPHLNALPDGYEEEDEDEE